MTWRRALGTSTEIRLRSSLRESKSGKGFPGRLPDRGNRESGFPRLLRRGEDRLRRRGNRESDFPGFLHHGEGRENHFPGLLRRGEGRESHFPGLLWRGEDRENDFPGLLWRGDDREIDFPGLLCRGGDRENRFPGSRRFRPGLISPPAPRRAASGGPGWSAAPGRPGCAGGRCRRRACPRLSRCRRAQGRGSP